MFCLYCGTDIPDDAVFCNSCGKRQKAVIAPATDITVLPSPPLPAPPATGGQSPAGSVPMAQGTPAVPGSPSLEGGATANVGSSGGASTPLTQSSSSLQSSGDSPSQAFLTRHPGNAPQSVASTGVKLAGGLSRRAVILGLAAGTAVFATGGGIALLTLARKSQALTLSSSSVNSSTAANPGVVVNLGYSTDLNSWGINYDRPSALQLSNTPPNSNWVQPPTAGIRRLFGILQFGDKTQVGVIVDELAVTQDFSDHGYFSAQVVFNFDGGTDFTNQPTYQVNGDGSAPIEFDIGYNGGSRQKYAISAYTYVTHNNGTDTYILGYYRACVRQGTVRIDGVDYPLAITDENNDGLYSDLDNIDVSVDLNRNGKFEDNEHISATTFTLKGYHIRNIAPDGTNITFTKAGS